jgi:hypothetical protein
MSEQDPKGFKVVDKRGMADEEREKLAAPPRAEPPHETGNRPATGSVESRKSPAGEQPTVGGPTFLDLVGTLQFGAMAHLGMIQTPDGERPPVNLPAAKDSIDILAILREKTKGNLTPEENEVLGEGLYHLRMAYLAAMNAGQGAGGKEK